MSEQQKKPHVWHWATALLIGLPVLYVASFGPVSWMTDGRLIDKRFYGKGFYTPLTRAMICGPRLVSTQLFRYATAFHSKRYHPAERDYLDYLREEYARGR